MKKGNAPLFVIALLLFGIAIFEIVLFATYRIELVHGVIGVFIPQATETTEIDGSSGEEGGLDQLKVVEPSSSPLNTAGEEGSAEAQQHELDEGNDQLGSGYSTEPVYENPQKSWDGNAHEDNETIYTVQTPEITKEESTKGTSATVYITNTGSKYHSGWCQYLKGSKIPVDLSKAKAQGYTPCKTCRHGW